MNKTLLALLVTKELFSLYEIGNLYQCHHDSDSSRDVAALDGSDEISELFEILNSFSLRIMKAKGSTYVIVVIQYLLTRHKKIVLRWKL